MSDSGGEILGEMSGSEGEIPEEPAASTVPSEGEVVAAINRVFKCFWGSFRFITASDLLVRILDEHPTWILEEERVAQIKEQGLQDGRLKMSWSEAQQPSKIPTPELIQQMDEEFVWKQEWAEAPTATFADLAGSFTINSGELVWGQIKNLVAGMKAHKRDAASSEQPVLPGGTIIQRVFNYRTAARPGVWKLAKVAPCPRSMPDMVGWIAYHSSQDPAPLVEAARRISFQTRADHPRIRFVNRYDWSWHGPDPGSMDRTLARMDPVEYGEAYEIKRELWLHGRLMDRFHQGFDKWERLEGFYAGKCMLVDAQKAAEVVKLIARPSQFDDRITLWQNPMSLSTSLYSQGSEDQGAIGCHLNVEGEYEVARLIYGEEKSIIFPGEDELVAFWYDNIHYDYDEDQLAQVPTVEVIP